MGRIRTKNYDLNCYKGEYEALTRLLTNISLSHQNGEGDEKGWQEFIMPNGTVRISLKDERQKQSNGGELEGRVQMSVKRTTLREPKYIKQIVKRLDGMYSGVRIYTNKDCVDLYLSENYHQFRGRQ